jgi:hypothetical protein
MAAGKHRSEQRQRTELIVHSVDCSRRRRRGPEPAMNARDALLVVLMLVAALAGCDAAASSPPNPAVSESGASRCHLRSRNNQSLPDPVCTPGAVNPAVNQASIGDTICRSGWTATVRPASSVTTKIKRRVTAEYGLPTGTQGELDHLISLELGGAPSDPTNLWVEPGAIPNPKDTVENQLRRAVCAGLIPLAAAQQAIAADWTTAVDTTGLLVANGKVCLRSNPARCAGSRGGGS